MVRPSSLTLMLLPKSGDIFLVNFDPTIGAEIRKTGPAGRVPSFNGIGNVPICIWR